MDIVSFDKLLLTTAFCCMASDGHIDNREITLIKTMCENSPLFKDFNFQEEINFLINSINSKGKEFISNYFKLLEKSSLTKNEELTLIDFAIKTIKADELIEYSEIKFFKNIRHRLRLSNEDILEVFPDIEDFLEEDIVSEFFIYNIPNQYMEAYELPMFELIRIDKSPSDS